MLNLRLIALILAGCSLAWSASAAKAADAPTQKAYMVVVGKVFDREAFREGYAKKLPPLYAKYGGTYLAAGRSVEVLEGSSDAESYVVAEWPSMAAARAFWNSPEYTEIRNTRIANKWGAFTVFLLEGIPPTQVAPMAKEKP